MQLRPYQQKLKAGLYGSWSHGNRNVVLVSPTGSGKTVVMGSIAKDQTVPGCVIAHRTELVAQISLAMARFGIAHNIIGPSTTVRFCIAQQIAELGRKFYDPRGLVTVAAVDTLMARADSIGQWAADQRWWMIDECFPAGTLVDGRPIETLRVGDMVTSFDEDTGTFHKRSVVRLFKNPTPDLMVRVATAHHVVYATFAHPFWTQRGWVNAIDLMEGDHVLCDVRSACNGQDQCDDEAIQSSGSRVLQQRVFEGVSSESIVQNNGADQREVCLGTHDEEQSNASGISTVQDATDLAGHEPQAKNSRRQWCASDTSRSEADGVAWSAGFCGAICDCHGDAEGCRTGALQNRLCECGVQDCCGGGRFQSHLPETASIGSSQGRVFAWQRVDSASVHQRDDSGRTDDGYVYNIEVADFHTYVANGVVVHNCHHAIQENKWGKATTLFTNAYGCGVTATPLRADRKSLHIDQGGIFSDMIVGPAMRELINAGSLCDYRIFAPPQSIDVSNVKIGSTGDYSQPGLREAAHKSRIVGDVVAHYLKLARGLRGITFTVDVEQAIELANAFTEAGVPAMAVSAKTPDAVDRKSVV